MSGAARAVAGRRAGASAGTRAGVDGLLRGRVAAWGLGGTCAAAALLLLCALQLVCLLRAPAAWMPARVSVALARGMEAILPAEALGLPQGEGGSLKLRRDTQGGWWLANGGLSRLVVVGPSDLQRRSGSVGLARGQQFRVGASTFTVDEAGAHGLALSRGEQRWRYDGATLVRNGAAQPACPETHVGGRLAALWNRWLPGVLGFPRPLVFGGNLDCGNRIAIEGLPAPAALLARSREGLVLSAAAGPGAAPLLLLDAKGAAPLAEREQGLEGASALVLGRTRLLLRQDGDLLHMQPVSHVALYREAQRGLPDGVAWSWAGRGYWHLPPSAPLLFAAVLALALGAGVPAWLAGRARRCRGAGATGAATALAGCGIVLLVLQKSGNPAGAGIHLLFAWAALWTALLGGRRTSLAGAAGVLLLAAGLLAQLELGLGADESSWLRHVEKTSALLAIGVGAGVLWKQLALLRRPAPPSQARTEAALMLLATVALAGLLLQVAFGDETGVFDLQPVEFAKLALACLTAHCLALATGARSQAPARERGGALLRVLRIAAPALLFLVLLAVALVQVDDYSPLLLLLAWGGALVLAYACATGQRLLACACLAGALAAVAAVALLRGAGPAGLAQWNFYADRFLVWLDPATHPHTGQQLLLGARAIADGGWRGADGMFGLASLGQEAGFLLRIPAVQDDFAPSFFLNRHGLASALVLWLLQALFLAGLLRTAIRCWLAAGGARDYRLAWRARLFCFLLCGGAAFVFGHFLLSWGTNLAIFPVMGQPMSFLSAGGSHLLFFICPLLAFNAAGCHHLEENESCPD